MRRASLLLLAFVALTASPADAARGKKGNQLLRITTPSGTARVAAHPFVNVVVRFGLETGTVDPGSFKANLGGVNVTPLFTPITENGTMTGMRAAIGPALLSIGGHRANRLRLEVRGRVGKRSVRDVDRLRFRAMDVPDEAPVARVLAASDIILASVPMQFDGTQSHDPEDDVLDYLWEFDDGTTSTDPKPVHVFGSNEANVRVRLTVSDGQLTSSDEAELLAAPTVDPGRTPGLLTLQASGKLEFGPVPLGTSGTRTFTVHNPDTTPTSQLRVRLGTSHSAFTVTPADLDLGPDESADVNLAFGPTSVGHQSAEVTIVASASNQAAVHVLSHGYGGDAPASGTGPLPMASPLYYNTLTQGTFAIRPDGSQFFADNTVHTCVVPQNGPGIGDLCVVDADCASNNGTCPTTSTCVRGTNAGQPCSTTTDCPGGFCPSYTTFDPIDMCGDGEGGLYLMSDEGTYTDPAPTDTELSGSILHVRFDPSGNRTAAEIIERTSAGTTQLACDAIPAAAGGQIYIAAYRAVTSPGDCFRDSREALIAKRKSNGNEDVLMSRIDAAEGLDPCDDYDPSDDLQTTRTGSAVFVALPNGVYRIRPTTLLMTPDIDDIFQVHPDGSVIVVTSGDSGPSGLVRVYKISQDQAVNGAPKLADLSPCATIEVPNNRGPTTSRLTTYISFAAGPTTPGSIDATILVSLFSGGGTGVLPQALKTQGTFAISSPGGSSSCTVLGLVNLEPLDQLAF